MLRKPCDFAGVSRDTAQAVRYAFDLLTKPEAVMRTPTLVSVGLLVVLCTGASVVACSASSGDDGFEGAGAGQNDDDGNGGEGGLDIGVGGGSTGSGILQKEPDCPDPPP